MSLTNKRIVARWIELRPDGKCRGETECIFELDKNELIWRDIKPLHTKVNREFKLSEWQIDIYMSDKVTQSSLSTAVAGGILFGGAGAVVGAIVGQGKPTWILEIKNDKEILFFRIRNDSHQKALRKYLDKKRKPE